MKNTHEMEGILKQMESLSDKDKIAYLFGIIDQEKDKSWDQIDFEKIEECSRHIGKLIESELPELTDERIEDIRKKNDARLKAAHRPAPKKRKLVKRIIGIAAAVAILFCVATITVSAYSEGMSIGEYIVYVAKNLFPGESVERNGITFIHEEEMITYDDIESLIEDQKLDIYYPSELPKGVYIEKIVLTGDLSGIQESKLIFVFNSSDITFSIQNYQSVNLAHQSTTMFETPIGYFYLMEINGKSQAISQIGNYEYALSANDDAVLKNILKGLKQS